MPNERTIATVRLCRLRMSVHQPGRIDLYPWMYFLAQRARRHLQQMASIEAELNPPRARE